MKNLLNLIVILLAISSCSIAKHKGYTISGNVTGFPDSTMIYLKNLNTQEIIDSTLIIDNGFQLKGQLQDVPEQFWLYTTVNDEFIYTNLLIGNEDIKVEGDISDFPWNMRITGSKTQDDYNYLHDLTKSNDIKRSTLVKAYFELSPEEQDERRKPIWGEIRAIDKTNDSLYVEYIKSHIDTYPGVIYLGYNKESFPKDTVRVLYNKIPEEIKNSKYARVIEIYLNEKISEIGDRYHDFTAIDKGGDTVRFSDLMTGKYILLDFTSATCGPCVQSAEELGLIDKTYSDSLKIICFSGDANKELWLKSLERDSATWISLWDGKGKHSETYIKYGVTGFPEFFLIDPKGVIIDKWNGYGESLLEYKLRRLKSK